MSPELKQAVQERIELGHTKEQIASELEAAGYDHDSIETIYAAVTNSETAASSSAQSLPRNRELFATAWSFMTSRLDLVAGVAVPSVVIGLLEYVSTTSSQAISAPLGILFFVAVIALVVFAVLVQIAVIYAAINHAKGVTVSIGDGIKWAASNFFGWLWLVLLSGLVIMGGWLLLIIPGIIAMVYIGFSQYAFVDEGVRGMAALQRSRQLVYGKFGSVLWRLFVMMMFVILLYIPVGIMVAIMQTVADQEVTTLVTVVIEGLVSGVVGVLVVYYLTTLYQALKAMPVTPVTPTNWYKVYAGLGVLFFILMVSLPIIFFSALQEFGTSLDSADTPTLFQLEQEQMNAEMQAELEAFQQQFQAEFEQN